jgi:hypothetical protein
VCRKGGSLEAGRLVLGYYRLVSFETVVSGDLPLQWSRINW